MIFLWYGHLDIISVGPAHIVASVGHPCLPDLRCHWTPNHYFIAPEQTGATAASAGRDSITPHKPSEPHCGFVCARRVSPRTHVHIYTLFIYWAQK